MRIKKITYLLGAGATHAEILNTGDPSNNMFLENSGLLISDVSKRVMRVARSNKRFRKYVELVTSTQGSINIELLISLIESNQISDSSFKITHLKKLIQADIEKRLSTTRRKKFYLHRSLFELHSKTKDREDLYGIISLNYDTVVDDAYKAVWSQDLNYCYSIDKGIDVPLLKLHGSFGWTNVKIFGHRRKVPIMPLGINKNYLIPPYNFIWGRALETLINCDILRIIGCSLNPNDLGLVDLLFKAHLQRKDDLEIQIIDFPSVGDEIKKRYGFFSNIVTMGADMTEPPISVVVKDVGNPFEVWLKAMADYRLDKIQETRYLKKCR